MSLRKLIFTFAITGIIANSVFAQTPAETSTSAAKPVLSEGEINGRDVYVRSGASLNHYEVCKLQMGDKVSIVGVEGDWYEILPPKDTFSLVSGDYVDTTDNKSGVINGTNVRVRAGSSLNANKYTVQTMLSRGANVTILGSNPDGFLRIAPPAGATLWINKQFVKAATTVPGDVPLKASTDEPAADASAKKPEPTPATESTTSKETGSTPVGAFPTAVNSASPTPTPVTTETSKSTIETSTVATKPSDEKPQHEYRKELEALDTAARGELAKDVGDRNWQPLIAKYEHIMKQADDEVSRVYAKHRVDQLNDFMTLTTAIRDLESRNGDSDEVRRNYLKQRGEIPPPPPFNREVGLDAQGELRVSALYPPGSQPRRFRLIDPTTPSPKTVAYVEIPADSKIEIDSHIGRYVGVRASDRSLQTSGVNPVPILVASEIVSLPAPASSGQGDAVTPAKPAAVGAQG